MIRPTIYLGKQVIFLNSVNMFIWTLGLIMSRDLTTWKNLKP